MNKSIVIFLLIAFTSCKSEKEVKPVVQDIKELVFASGELEWDDAYNLTAQTDGVLKNADFEVGDKVVIGHVLASIDNKSNQINTQVSQEQLVISNENLTAKSPQLQQLKQNIQFADSKYNQDKIQANRYERLYASQSISRLEYENMQLTAKNSLSNLNALLKQEQQVLQQAKFQQIGSKGQVQNTKVIQGYNQVTVSQGGTVIKKIKTSGDYVRKGDVIATIADEQKVQAVLNVDENSIGKVKIGQLVFVQLNTEKGKVYHGKINEILAAFDNQTQSFICKASFETSLQRSLFGTQLEANILVNEKKNALLIPRNYLGFGNKVNIKDKGESIEIKIGIVSTDYVEVLQGIDQNDVLLPLKL